MNKIILVFIILFGLTETALAVESHNIDATQTALWITALITAVIHTLTGPDHYLPFIAIARARNYSLKKTLIWTFICGLGHIGSALLIALFFIYFSQLLSEADFVWLEDNRSDLAAYTLIGLGAAYLLWALRHRILHRKGLKHKHAPIETNNQSITVWVLFIIFVLGPCEALLPILTASSVVGTSAVISNTVIFSIATIATMMSAVALGLIGIKTLKFEYAEKYAHEIAGTTIMVCGLAIVFGL